MNTGMSHGNMYLKMIVSKSWSWLHQSHLLKSHESSQTCFCMCSTASYMLYYVLYSTLHVQNSTTCTWDQSCQILEKVSFRTCMTDYYHDGYEHLAAWNGIWPPCYAQGTVLMCAFILRVSVCMYFGTYYRGMKHGGHAESYVILRFTL